VLPFPKYDLTAFILDLLTSTLYPSGILTPASLAAFSTSDGLAFCIAAFCSLVILISYSEVLPSFPVFLTFKVDTVS
jgi:hypothetical protein